MDGYALLGLLAILYAVMVVYIAAKKPPKLWEMAKIKMFRKVLGEQGTVTFFYVFALLAVILGIWLIQM